MSDICNISPVFWGIEFCIHDIPDLSTSSMCFSFRTITSVDPVISTITYEDDFVILSSNQQYSNVQVFTSIYEDMTHYAGTFKKEFRWSVEDATWSDWIELSLNNLNHYIRRVEYKDFYIEFKYTMLTEGMLTIRYILLEWDEHSDKIKKFRPFPVAYAREKGNNKYPVKLKPFSYNPYNQNNTIKLQKDLNFIVNNMYGHEITYFLTLADKRSQDIIFNEYSLSNVQEPKCLKVVVPNNEFPDNKFNFNSFGIDYDLPFEVHVDKRYFEWVFGSENHPSKRDIIYFNLNDRMYEVMSAQIVRDFMQKPLYYKLSLIKYQPKASRIEPDIVKNKIDEYTQGFEKLFGEDFKAELEQTTNPQQNIERSTVFDPTRQWTYPLDFIVRSNIDNFGTIISKYHYDISHLYGQLGDYIPVIRYKSKSNFLKDRNMTYTAWFKEEQKPTTFKPVFEIVNVSGNEITVRFEIMPNLKNSQWMGLTSTNNTNFDLFGQIQEIKTRPAERTIKFRAPNYILNKANVAFPTWQQDTGLLAKEIFRRNFLYGYDESSQKGIRIDSLNSKHFRISLNDMRFWFDVPRFNANLWYGMVLNIAKLYQSISLNIYTLPNTNLKTTKLQPYYESYIKNIYDNEFELNSYFEILASNLRLTNIRLLNERLEPEKHSIFLNMNIIRDAHLAMIIDNADPKIREPYIGNVQ